MFLAWTRTILWYFSKNPKTDWNTEKPQKKPNARRKYHKATRRAPHQNCQKCTELPGKITCRAPWHQSASETELPSMVARLPASNLLSSVVKSYFCMYVENRTLCVEIVNNADSKHRHSELLSKLGYHTMRQNYSPRQQSNRSLNQHQDQLFVMIRVVCIRPHL